MTTIMTNAVREIDAATADQWLNENQAILVDVREPGEHASEHIPQATLHPLSKLQPGHVPEQAGRKLIVHCQGGGRSRQAVAQWQASAKGELYNLAGGLNAWKLAGLPTERSPGAPRMDVQRQLHLIIGLGVLTGVILGAWVSSWFLLLAALFGAGLTMAALTGVCPMAMFIARLPWNQRHGQPAKTSPSCCAPSATTPSVKPAKESSADTPGCCGR